MRFVSILMIIIFVTMSMASMGQAQGISTKLRMTDAKARVTQVVDGKTIIVNDNETLHLPMIYIPTSARGDNSAMKAAKDYLDQTLKDQFISVFQVRNNERALQNALGHTEAYVMSNGVFIQEDIVRKGLAFVYPSPSHHAVADILYEAEVEARENKAGLWGKDYWQILTDQEVKEVDNRFVIVEGRIERVATRKNVIYLNFERDWKKDFTVAIASNLRRDFSKANKSVMQLGNKAVRVRGWVRDYNGPYMEVMHPSQIEIIQTPKGEREIIDDRAQDIEDARLLDEWGLDIMGANNIAPKVPAMGEDWQTNRPFAAEPLKPIVPTQSLTQPPAAARSPAQEVPQGVIDAQTPSNDFMDRGLLDQNAGPDRGK